MKLSLRRRSNAFTLLEIMLVVVIIALLAGAAIFKMAGNLDAAKVVKAKTDIQAFATSLMVYQGTNGTLPSTSQGLKALIARPQDEPRPRNWTQLQSEVVLDPWNKEYLYTQPGSHNPRSYDLFSAGPDGIPGNEDDIGNWQ